MLISTFGNLENARQDPLPLNWQEQESGERDVVLPRNFGVVVPERLYRSGLPWLHQIEELKEQYGLKHVVSLLSGKWLNEDYLLNRLGIQHHQFDVLQRSALTRDRVKDILAYIDKLQGPILVHCLKGVVRTGHVVAGYEMWEKKVPKPLALAHAIRHKLINISSLREIARY